MLVLPEDLILDDKSVKECKLCSKELVGVMLFYPDLCLSCVADHECTGKLKDLKEYHIWFGLFEYFDHDNKNA